MSTLPKRKYTPAEYLALERESQEKHEYFEGEIFAMAGGKKEHARISGNLYRFLANKLDGGSCEPFNSDMAVKVAATGLYTYPDASVACGPEFEEAAIDVLLNPRVLFEVLSATTERHDRKFKFGHYQRIPSVSEIIFVTQDDPYVERFIRVPGALWQFGTIEGLEGAVRIDSIDCELTMAEIYQGVEFPPEDSPRA